MNLVLLEPYELNRPLAIRDPRAIHVLKILKLKIGDQFRAGICEGEIGLATLTEISAKAVRFSFEPTEQPPLPHKLTLLCGIPRANSLRRILKDATSLGVEAIRLVATDLGEKSYRDAKILRPENSRPILFEGAAQAYTTLIPQLSIHPHLDSALQRCSGKADGSANCYFHNDPTLPHAWQYFKARSAKTSAIMVAIGSERGWSKRELQLLAKNDLIGLQLGSRVLRTDTAFIAAISLARGFSRLDLKSAGTIRFRSRRS